MNIGKTLFAQLMDFLPWSTFTRIVTRYGGDQRVRTLIFCGFLALLRGVDLNSIWHFSGVPKASVNIGKTLFAQLMDFLPWSTFTRIVTRYGGDQRVRTLSCAEHYRAMAFAQLTYRESLRDIETCLSAQASKLYAMGFRDPVRRSTLADANEGRDWRIYAELAQRLIAQARKLYLGEDLGFDLANTVYALNSTTIDLCLAVFPWAHFRTAKAAVKMHTLLDLRGNIPSFIHISDGKLHDVHGHSIPLLPEAGAMLCHGSRLRRVRPASRFASGRRVLHHARQIEYGFPPRLLGPS